MKIQHVRIKLIREKTANYRIPVESSGVAWLLASRLLGDMDREMCIVMCLDGRNQINLINTVAIGSLDSAIVSPREVFKAAILSNSAAIILAHNHPSGDPAPSEGDISVTRRIVRAGHILEINLLDHIIIGENSYRSMKESDPHLWGNW